MVMMIVVAAAEDAVMEVVAGLVTTAVAMATSAGTALSPERKVVEEVETGRATTVVKVAT